MGAKSLCPLFDCGQMLYFMGAKSLCPLFDWGQIAERGRRESVRFLFKKYPTKS